MTNQIISDHNDIIKICPITKKTFIDPVVAEDGITYEKNAIEEYFKNNNVSFVTKKSIKSKQLFPNFFIKYIIENSLLGGSNYDSEDDDKYIKNYIEKNKHLLDKNASESDSDESDSNESDSSIDIKKYIEKNKHFLNKSESDSSKNLEKNIYGNNYPLLENSKTLPNFQQQIKPKSENLIETNPEIKKLNKENMNLYRKRRSHFMSRFKEKKPSTPPPPIGLVIRERNVRFAKRAVRF